MHQENKNHACPFCRWSDISSRLVCELDDAYVISDAHPVTKGHLLIVSKTHHLAFGAMTPSSLSRLRQAILGISHSLAELNSRVILFEHGNQAINRSGRPSVDHAHFHLIPTADLQLYLPASKKSASFLNLQSYVAECSYYFYWDIFDDVAYWGNANDVEPQFIRRVAAFESGLVNWNWRANPFSGDEVKLHSKMIRSLLVKRS